MPRTLISARTVSSIAAHRGRITAPQLAEILGCSPGQARTALERQVACGELLIAVPGHRGHGCARVYEHPVPLRRLPALRLLTRAADDPLSAGASVSYAQVRAAVYALKQFSVAQLAAEVGCSDATLRKHLPQLLARNTIEQVSAPAVGRAAVYAHVRPVAPATPRAAGTDQRAARRGSGAVAGTGRGRRLRKDVAAVVREAQLAGLQVADGSKHLKLVKDGLTVCTVPGSPSDHRSLRNLRSEIRRAV